MTPAVPSLRAWLRQGLFVSARPAPPCFVQARSAQTAARRRRAAALPAAAAGGPGTAPVLAPDADVDAAVRAACESLGRVPGAAEAALVERLTENWYCTAAELAGMGDADASSLRVPLRLRSAVATLLASDPPPAGAAAAAAAAAAAPAGGGGDGGASALGPLVAEELVSELLSGHGPLPLPGMGPDRGTAAAAPPSTASSSAADSEEGEEGQGDGQLAQPDLASIPIEERRCPPVRRAGNRADQAPRLKAGKSDPYALSEAQLPEELRQEFAAFHRFSTVRFFGQQMEPIAPVTAAKYADHIRGFLGWLHRHRGEPLGTLRFASGLPSHGREGVSIAFEYLQWLTGERGVSVRTERMALRALSHASKFLYHSQSKVRPGSGERPYSDLEIVKELKLLDSAARKAERVAPRVVDEEKKWLDWTEYLALVEELRKECAALDFQGRRRSDVAVAWSLQRFLMFAILSCIPDRQRTLRELEVGRTLFKERDRWVVRHGPGDYKTGKAYGERPPLVIAPHIYPELEAFIHKWRAVLEPTHNLLFTQQSGAPLTQQSVHKLFTTTAFRLSGKKLNPHLVRDSVVTYLRGTGASERELEALALYMGHSLEMQRSTYDRRTKQQKVEPAVELLESLNSRVLGRGGAGAGAGSGAGPW